MNGGFCLGVFWINLLSAMVLPSLDSSEDDLLKDNSWKIVFSNGIVFELITIILMSLPTCLSYNLKDVL
jgi:hypothetical protein